MRLPADPGPGFGWDDGDRASPAHSARSRYGPDPFEDNAGDRASPARSDRIRYGPDHFDETAGDNLVRPYLLAGGRSRPSQRNLEMITLVVAVTEHIAEPIGPEHEQIMGICRTPSSVAEVSARTHLPMVVVKIMLSDLIERGHIIYRSPPTAADTPSPELLQAVLDGILRL